MPEPLPNRDSEHFASYNFRLNSATLQWMLDSEDRDPRDHDTASLRSEIEDTYVAGWPESPTNTDYVLDDGRWVLSE